MVTLLIFVLLAATYVAQQCKHKAYFMALTIKFLERTKQCNENFWNMVQSWFSDRNSNWV